MSKCWEGPLNNFEIVFSHRRLHLNFPITWSCRRSEMLKMLPREKSEIQHFRGQTSFWGVFISFQFLLRIQNPQNMEVACSCVCDLDLAAAQVLWVILVNIWYLSKLNIRCGQTFWSQIKFQANIYMYLTSGSIPNSSRKIPIGVFFPRPRVSATLVTWKNDKIRFIMRKKWTVLLEQKHSKGGAHQLA